MTPCSTYLVLSFEHKHVGDPAERDAQVDDLSFGHFVGNVADVNDSGRLGAVRLVQLGLQHRGHGSSVACSVRGHS